MFIKTISKVLVTLPIIGLGLVMLAPLPVQALAGSDFQAGRIIDDAVFTNTTSMSIADINNFLSSKVPNCDTTGAASISYWYDSSTGYVGSSRERDANGALTNADTFVTSSRQVYGQRYSTYRGTSKSLAPYVCLKNYIENPNTHQNNLQHPETAVPGGVTPGEIIYYAGLHYHINPQVILTTLQKEQGLVTDDWPWTNEYTSAMGFNCPDDGTGCNGYAGFAIQVNAASAQLRNYLDHPSDFNFIGGQNNYVGYYPCNSGTTVFIQNQATAALYDYTPYQPDPSVLNATNPTGSANGPGGTVTPYDNCATYGNRNFWWYFNTWFGSTFAVNGSIQLASSLQLTPSSTPSVNDTVTATYQVKNTASYDIDAGGLGVCARIDGQYYDFGFTDHKTIPANSTVPVSFSKHISAPGSLRVFICSYNTAFGWAGATYPYDTTGTFSRETTVNVLDSPLVSSGITLSPANPAIGQEVTATLTIRNTSTSAINIGSMVIAARDPSGRNVDFPIENDAVIPPNGGLYTYSKKQTFTTPGDYSMFIANWNGVWTKAYPKSSDSSVLRSVTVNVLDNPLIISGITLSPATPSAGQQVYADFAVRNVSSKDINVGSMVIAARDPSGRNVDFPIIDDFIIPANSTKTYHQTKTLTTAGDYSLFIANWNKVWTQAYPKSADNTVVRNFTFKLAQ